MFGIAHVREYCVSTCCGMNHFKLRYSGRLKEVASYLLLLMGVRKWIQLHRWIYDICDYFFTAAKKHEIVCRQCVRWKGLQINSDFFLSFSRVCVRRRKEQLDEKGRRRRNGSTVQDKHGMKDTLQHGRERERTEIQWPPRKSDNFSVLHYMKGGLRTYWMLEYKIITSNNCKCHFLILHL